LILQLRLRRNLTVTEVAAYLGVTTAYYLELETGLVTAPTAMLVRLAELYSKPFETEILKEKIIININSGTGSHSNSGYVQNYANYPELHNSGIRLTEIENLLQLILLQLKN